MAATYFITRGHIDHVEKWERSMRNLWFPYKRKTKTIQGEDVEMQSTIDGQLRPIQFWEYVCPDEFKEPLWNSLGIPTNETYTDKEPGEQKGSFISGFGIQGYLTALRLALKANKFPKPDQTQPKTILTQPIYKQHVNILGIGWRKDENINTIAGNHEGI